MSETKKCSKCGEIKPLNSVYYLRTTRSGAWRSYCNLCGNEMCQSYKARNKEKISAYNKMYKSYYKEDISEYNREYNIKNREAIQERQTKQHRERRKNDMQYKIREMMSSRIRQEIKSIHNLGGQDSYFELLGCTPQFFKIWIEYQDDDGEYLWDDYGQWQFDHVNPCCNFDLTNESELKECFHWSNYRPLERVKNLIKNGNVDIKLINKQKIRATKFIEEYASIFFKENEYTII